MKGLGTGGWGLGLLLVAACHPSDVDPMKIQPKYKAYQASSLFDDGRAMRPQPEGTVAREHVFDAAPVKVDLDFVRLGRKRYEISCLPCHGQRGEGDGIVAGKMSLRLPPSLVTPSVRAMPDGRLFQVVSEGYGLMPPYASEIPVRERWAAVAYVRALQLSQYARLDQAPPDERRRLEAMP